MDLQFNNTYIKVQTVYSLSIKFDPIKKVISSPFWSFKAPEYQQEDSWTLTMDYLRSCGDRYIFTSKCKDYTVLKTQYDEIMKQIRDQDSQYANKLLEDAIIGGGTK